MKKTLPAVLSCAFLCLPLQSADEAAGFVRLSEIPGEDTAPLNDESRFVDLALDEHVAFSGKIFNATGDVLTARGAFWKVDQFVYTGDGQPRHYYVEIVTGSAAGSKFDIDANSGNALTVDLAGGGLAGIVAEEEIRVVSKWSLDLLFPNGGILTPSTDSISGTEIRFPTTGPGGVDYSGTKVYQYRSDLGRWIDTSDTATDVGADAIPVGSLVSIRQPNTDPLGFRFSGFKSQSGSPLALDVGLVEDEVPDVPEISIEQPANTDLTDGSALIDFGSVATNSSGQRTFTIRNDGTASLTGLGATIDGANSADFSAGALNATTLEPNEITTFTVTFSPSALGGRSASLHIASNDTDENPFDIALSGIGTAPPVNLDPPTNVVASDGIHEGEVRITWDASNGATEYEVYRGTIASGSDAVLIGSTSETMFTDTGGNIDEEYFYFVSSKDGEAISALSTGDAGRHETPLPTFAPLYRPDGLVGKKANALLGNNVYNSRQEVKQTSKKGKKLTWYFGIQNDGNASDQLAVSLTRSSKDLKLTLRSAGGGNVTAAANTGSLASTLASGQPTTFKFEVKPSKKAKGKSKKQAFVLSTGSINDGSKGDSVTAMAQLKK